MGNRNFGRLKCGQFMCPVLIFIPSGGLFIRSFVCYFIKILNTIKIKSVAQTRKYRMELNDRIRSAGQKEINRFFALDSPGYWDGTFPVRKKGLMGPVGSMVSDAKTAFFTLLTIQFRKVSPRKIFRHYK